MIRSDAPRRAEPPFGERRSIAVILDAGGDGVALAGTVGEVDAMEREVDRAERTPVRRSMLSGTRTRSRPHHPGAGPRRRRRSRQHLGLVAVRRRDLDRAADRAVARDEPGEDLRPPRSTR
jgi:hypothetical protein